MGTSKRYSEEVRERAVRMVAEHLHEYSSQWAAITSIAAKIGCTAESLRRWVHGSERDSGKRAGMSTSERERVKDLERENRELKRANEILRKASLVLLTRRSSTAAGSDDGVHRCPSCRVRSRADLRLAADRSVELLRAEGA
jgi:transposase